jgi:anti-sigma regulatory factor (Ser/Thr protein kinase)
MLPGAMAAAPSIRLSIPGTLAYRGVAVRVVAEASRMITSPPPAEGASIEPGKGYDLRDPFDAEVVSAFAEIFNNIAIHAYERRGGGDVELTITVAADTLIVEIRDHGAAFDLSAVARPDLDSLPEGGMGIHIARALMDEVTYEPGPPNLWRLVKRHHVATSAASKAR